MLGGGSTETRTAPTNPPWEYNYNKNKNSTKVGYSNCSWPWLTSTPVTWHHKSTCKASSISVFCYNKPLFPTAEQSTAIWATWFLKIVTLSCTTTVMLSSPLKENPTDTGPGPGYQPPSSRLPNFCGLLRSMFSQLLERVSGTWTRARYNKIAK